MNVVRMGLLASGAAHELGTPLASVSVILSDWKRMPGSASNGSLASAAGHWSGPSVGVRMFWTIGSNALAIGPVSEKAYPKPARWVRSCPTPPAFTSYR